MSNENMTLLLDDYNDGARMLRDSFICAGRDLPTVVISSDGFLPDGVLCPFEYFLGDYSCSETLKGSPLFFNEIQMPDYWRIDATNSKATIFDLTKERARIEYHKLSGAGKRLVQCVKWLDDAGVVRCIDHYNRYGALYAKTVLSAQGKAIAKSYFAVDGREVICENFQAKAILLTERIDGNEVIRSFTNRTEFTCYFLKRIGRAKDSFFYNSLSTPFLVSLRLKQRRCDDVLFWQEGPRKDVPGNMQVILEGRAPCTKAIYVQNRQAYDKFIDLGVDPNKIDLLGFVHSFKKDNRGSNQALICTNSDQLLEFDTLARELPDVHFNIVAKTEMSQRLLDKGRYPNVTTYQRASSEEIEDLFLTCDWFFDINRGSGMSNTCYKAFLHNHLIFGFLDVAHNKSVMCKEHACKAEDVDIMVLAVKALLSNKEILEAEVERQREYALAESPQRYAAL